jgi:hypothetical protein
MTQMMINSISMSLFSVDGISGVYSMDKFLVAAYRQQAREVNGGTGEDRWDIGQWDSACNPGKRQYYLAENIVGNKP